MLTVRENFLETIHRGSPDRFVNGCEPFAIPVRKDPVGLRDGHFSPEGYMVNEWGVSFAIEKGYPGPMPVHNPDTIVLKDVTQWESIIKAPDVDHIPENLWETYVEYAASIDRNQQLLCISVFPGLFDQMHMLMGMEEAMVSMITEPDAVRGLVEFYADYHIRYATKLIEHANPDAVFQHDDWGSSLSTFCSPAMFEDLFLPSYKRLYSFYRDSGIEVICHHSDSYAATFVPFMIALGVDAWQGVVSTNNIPALIEEYGDELTFMGGIDSSVVDREDWDRDEVTRIVEDACRDCGTKSFIPCLTMGGVDSLYSGVDVAVAEEIDRMSKLMF